MEDDYVRRYPTAKGDDGYGLKWLKNEFARSNAKFDSCMSVLNVLMEDVKFIKNRLLDGSERNEFGSNRCNMEDTNFSRENVRKAYEDEGIPRTDREHGIREDFKNSLPHVGYDFSYRQKDFGVHGHDEFGSYQSTPPKKESNTKEKKKRRPNAWASKKSSPQGRSHRQTVRTNIEDEVENQKEDEDLCSPRHPSKFVFTPPLRRQRKPKCRDGLILKKVPMETPKKQTSKLWHGEQVFNHPMSMDRSTPTYNDQDPIFGQSCSTTSFEYVLGRRMLMNQYTNIRPAMVVVEYER
ncbi:rho GTPase-activating protein 32 isoform 2 [Corchorus olitorius]|uniref:Rho GTPase-activating protein 32 isoform 2 n=1 Tax=Corchorus olitorius TaxID=93759 RepID=A0A1R3GDP4_9ROSI|nr:rho GTPase-activating protein 32 isoform 2 [Corchorus olitorius]